MKRKILTKKALIWRSFRLPQRTLDLWRAAAAREEISQSEFVRRALEQRARNVLLDAKDYEIRPAFRKHGDE